MTKEWNETAWCNPWLAADVRVIVTTERTTVNKRWEKRGKTVGQNSFSRDKHKVFLYLQKYNKEHEKCFCCKMECRSLFCFWKNATTNCGSKAETSITESTNRFFLWQQKGDIVFSNLFKKKRVFLSTEKWTAERQILSKSRIFRKDVTKKKGK